MKNSTNAPHEVIRSAQVITVAMAGGIMFAAVILWVVTNRGAPAAANQPQGPQQLSMSAGLLALTTIPMAFFVPNLAVNSGLKKLVGQNPSSWNQELAKLFLSKHIFFLAFFEAPAMFCAIVYLIERNPWMMAFVASAIGMMVLNVPTTRSVQAQLETWKNQIESERGK